MDERENKVRQFHDAMDQPSDIDIKEAWVDLLDLRIRLIQEEVNELWKEHNQITMARMRGETPSNEMVEKLIKELADLQYVVSGYAVTFGIPLGTAFSLVHHSNMSKLGTDGKPIKREDGKVIKGPNYSPPNLSNLV